MNFREKFIKENVKVCFQDMSSLNDWEKRFVKDMAILANSGHDLTTGQYNTLNEIATKIKKGR